MKKSIMIAIGAALAAIAVSVFVYASNGNNDMDDLFYANVEALAGDENGGSGCTGPKKQNIAGNVFCHCENMAPCMDMYGCQ